MHKKKIEIVELNLGMEVGQEKISEETSEKINNLITQAEQEKISIEQTKIPQDKIKACYDLLVSRTMLKQEVAAEELLNIAKNASLSILIVGIKHYNRERGGLWKVMKKKKQNKTTYFLIAS